jgi:hypothetical protein
MIGPEVLMISRVQKGDRGGTIARSLAIFCAALILVSQTIGVAHFHEGAVPRDGTASSQINADPGFCPICQLALHSPGSVTAATTIARGPAIAEDVFLAAAVRFASPVFSAARGRAPPVSL